ncbi:hypothetical protein ACFS2C_13650 [Prauserella oleivorans]|uniref:Uncharacterized protein n=1 Tax=Prauserella oleivorans TaxID=1478153 RepID=A0ABW5W909_9PSEU
MKQQRNGKKPDVGTNSRIPSVREFRGERTRTSWVLKRLESASKACELAMSQARAILDFNGPEVIELAADDKHELRSRLESVQRSVRVAQRVAQAHMFALEQEMQRLGYETKGRRS